MKASEKLMLFKKKSQLNNSKAQLVAAKTELKFRELFESADAPEFKILPDPTSIFHQLKATEKLEQQL